MKVIYDLGANNGDDIPYYLLKADLVVAVEANPVLTDQIKTKFAQEIASGRLRVENCAVTVEAGAESVPFYVNLNHHVQSQFVKPQNVNAFKEIMVPSRNIVDIIREHGDPYYVKIDIEHYDQFILQHLFANNIRPEYISSEAHIVDVFCILVDSGHYNRFKLVLGGNVPSDYSNLNVVDLDGTQHTVSFPHHSAGPFGDDVKGPWRNTGDFFKDLKSVTFGWIDIHATTK